MFGLAMEGSLTFFAASPLVATPTVVSKSAAMSVCAPGQASVQSHDVRRESRRARGPDGVTTTFGDAPDVSERSVDGEVTRDANHTTDTRCIDAREVGARVKIFPGAVPFSSVQSAVSARTTALRPASPSRAAAQRKHQTILSPTSTAPA
jgi:hypothetical protein